MPYHGQLPKWASWWFVTLKNLPVMEETQVQSLKRSRGGKDGLPSLPENSQGQRFGGHGPMGSRERADTIMTNTFTSANSNIDIEMEFIILIYPLLLLIVSSLIQYIVVNRPRVRYLTIF